MKEWAALWKVQVPSKVRVFLWRLARQSIPAQDVRCRRNMVENSRYNLCGVSDSWKHSLLECHVAKAVWALEKEEITGVLCMINEDAAKAWLSIVWKTMFHNAIT